MTDPENKTEEEMHKIERNPLLSLMAFILFASVIAFLVYTFRSLSIVAVQKILPADTAAYIEVDLEKIPEKYQKKSKDKLSELFLEKINPSLTIENLKEFAGAAATISWQKSGTTPDLFIHVIQKKKAEEFLTENFLLPNESFRLIDMVDENKEVITTIFTPEFSSEHYFAFFQNYLIISSSEKKIKHIIIGNNKLEKEENFREIFRDLPSKNLFTLYVNTKNSEPLILQTLKEYNILTSNSPLQKTLSQAIPSFGLSLNFNDAGELSVRTKFMADDGLHAKSVVKKSNIHKNMPLTAQATPQDVLFYQSGINLYDKYTQTKIFLSSVHKDMPLIFDAALRAQSHKIFGKNFDFDKDFLAQLNGEYAFIINYEDSAYPFTYYTFISQTKMDDREKLLNQFHTAIHETQSYNQMIEDESVLPSGKKISALTIKPEKEIAIKKIEEEDFEYFSIQNPDNNAHFSYGVVDNFFIISSHKEGLSSAINTSRKKTSSLAYLTDFSSKINQVFSPSESYGRINIARLKSALNTVKVLVPSREEKTTEKTITPPATSPLIEGLQKIQNIPIKNITTNRKVFPKSVYYQAIINLE